MIRAQIEGFEESADPFAHGLRAWFAGESSYEAEAAGIVFSQTVLLIRDALTKEWKG